MSSIRICMKQLRRIPSGRIRDVSAADDFIHTTLLTNYSVRIPSSHQINANNFSTEALQIKTKSSHKAQPQINNTLSILDQSDQAKDQDNNEEVDEGPKKRVVKNRRELLQLAWADYTSTWEGFFDNAKLKKEEEQKQEDDYLSSIDTEAMEQKGKDLKANVDRNFEMIKEEGSDIAELVKEKTGVRTQNDAKAWAMEQLKLANECVAEFMKGYREGRDEEIDKMMNEYFKDIDFDNEKDTKRDTAVNEFDSKDEDSDNVEEVQQNAGRRRRRAPRTL